MMNKTLYTLLFFIILFILGAETMIAQTTPPPPALPGTPTQAPIDGGLLLLSATGAAYAWSKLRKKD